MDNLPTPASLAPTHAVIAETLRTSNTNLLHCKLDASTVRKALSGGPLRLSLTEPLRDKTASVLLDLPDAFDPFNPSALSAGPSSVQVSAQHILKFARKLEESIPTQTCTPHVAVLAATCAPRLLKSLYLRVADAERYAVGTDDSYLFLALVPGKRLRVVESVLVETASGSTIAHTDRLVQNVVYAMLPICNPVGDWTEKCDYHSLLLLFSAASKVRALAEKVADGIVRMLDADGSCLLMITVTNETIELAKDESSICALLLLEAVLNGSDCPSHRVCSLISAERELGATSYAVHIALVVCQVAEESTHSKEGFRIESLRHSRIINHGIGFTSSQDVEHAVNVLSDASIKHVLSCCGFIVSIASTELDLEDTCSFDERERDHDKAGMLAVEKIDRRRVRVGSVKLQRGLGTPLSGTAPEISYFSRLRQNVLSVRDGRFFSQMAVNLKRDLFFFTKIKSLDVGIEHAGVEMQSGRPNEPLNDTIVNGLLRGAHGSAVARWIWAMLDGGAAFVHPSSAALCFLGSRIRTNNEGHRLFGPLSGIAVGECVVYYNVSSGKIFVDKYDVGELMEVVASEGELAHLVPAPLARKDRVNLRECVMSRVAEFCVDGEHKNLEEN